MSLATADGIHHDAFDPFRSLSIVVGPDLDDEQELPPDPDPEARPWYMEDMLRNTLADLTEMYEFADFAHAGASEAYDKIWEAEETPPEDVTRRALDLRRVASHARDCAERHLIKAIVLATPGVMEGAGRGVIVGDRVLIAFPGDMRPGAEWDDKGYALAKIPAANLIRIEHPE
jgi:hypothetical protein